MNVSRQEMHKTLLKMDVETIESFKILERTKIVNVEFSKIKS